MTPFSSPAIAEPEETVVSQAPAGWYADPAASSTWRWWDGAVWTDEVSSAVSPPATAYPYGVQPSYTPLGYGQPPTQQPMPMGTATGWRRNQYALYTFGIVVVYLLIAYSSRIVFIGFFPLVMSLRSQRAREPLAPVAIAASVIALIVGVLALTR